MKQITYSQAGQDLWVIKELSGKKNGYFLDIGAYDGMHFSNSYLLETAYSWNGLLVEANPYNFNKLMNNRPRSQNILACISDNNSILGITNGDMSSKISNQSSVSVQCITFKDLFAKYSVPYYIDYMSLDIEGYESKALSKFPFDTHICGLITVEHNMYITGPQLKNEIQKILVSNNYTLEKNNVSYENNIFEDWYIHNSLILR